MSWRWSPLYPWQDTHIELEGAEGEKWHNLLSGEQLTAMNDKGTRKLWLNQLLGHFPVALLANGPE